MIESNQVFRHILIAITLVLQIGCVSTSPTTEINTPPQHKDTAKISPKSVPKPVIYSQISSGIKCDNKKDEIEHEMCLCGKKAEELYNIYSELHSEIQQEGYQVLEPKRNILQGKYDEMKNCPMQEELFGWVLDILHFEWNLE
jgi:hypothetical protein